jgi:LDH2 family malate/lactate/ureidoglycolate dehydrogenase
MNIDQIECFLTGIGLKPFVAKQTAKVLNYSERAGKTSHGFHLLEKIRSDLNKGLVTSDLLLTKTLMRNGIVEIDCHQSLGYAAASVACRFGAWGAKKNGFCCILLKNIDHIGPLGYYCHTVSLRDCLCIMSAQGKARVPLHGSHIPFMGTTPLSFGIPCGDNPVVIDTCLALNSVNKLNQMVMSGKKSDTDIGWDYNGVPTKDPEEVLKGSLFPIGGHKGAAICFAIKILIGAISGKNGPGNHPVIMLIMDTASMPEFYENTNALLNEARETLPKNGEARLPGQRWTQ